MNLVMGHPNSRTKLIYPKKLKLKGYPPLIGFKLNEVPKKYYKNNCKIQFNHKGYSFYIPLDQKDFKL